MKLRNGKYSSGKVFTKASDTGSAKAKLKRQSNLCVLSETSGDSSGNKTIKDNFSTQKSLGTYSASRVTNSNNFAVKTVDQHSSLLNMSSDFPSRSKRSFIKNDLRSSSASSSDAVQSNVTGGKLQDNRPIVIDMTSGEEVEKVWNQKPKSSRNSIRNKERDCTNVVPVKGTDDLQVEVICSSKKKRNRSVEVVSRNVRTKRSDSVSSPTTKKQPEAANDVVLVSSGNINRGPSIDDECSIISIGSDEEIVVLDSTTKSKLNVNNSSDIIILDTPSPQKKKNSTVIDLCTPLNQSTPLRTQPKSKKDIECLNTRSLEPSISQQSQFKNYVSVLGSENNKSNFRATASGSVSAANEGSRNVWVSSGNFIPVTSCNPVWFAPSTSKYGNNIYNPNPDTVREGFRPVTNDGSNVATSCNPVRSALAPSTSKYGSNIYNPNPDAVKEGLRPIVIDGSNVAMGHGNGLFFSCRGLQICIDYFLKLNHKVIAFVPKYRRSSPQSKDTDILDKLEKQGLLTFTPSRRIGDRLVVAYDDRYIVQYAAECGGVIVSTDNYRDLLRENPAWRETIENRLLMFTWVGDIIMFPQDPLGRYGPNLENFLRFPAQQ
ncbi:uncharacterized protein [Periplaneta americana]|uniref:uncharacterized protein isoform X1 n=1 Tax=Periplaneta americana TaxID=6978 RepID=UPI0037E70F91